MRYFETHRSLMKRYLPIFLGIILIGTFAAGMAYRYNVVLSNEDFIRFHVVANSNSEEDQALKLKVRDRLIELIDDQLVKAAVKKSDGSEGVAAMDIEESRQYIGENMDTIIAEAENVIAEEGYNYPVRTEFGVCWIPEKTYGSVTFPAGNYEALKIMIGEAKGQNWWCVLYPPLCLIDQGKSKSGGPVAGGNVGNLPADEILRDSIMTGKYGALKEAAESDKPGTTLKLKFKTLEIVKRFA